MDEYKSPAKDQPETLEHTQRPDEPKRREIEIGTKDYNRTYKERQERHINSIWKT
jgi:hypothetical protein